MSERAIKRGVVKERKRLARRHKGIAAAATAGAVLAAAAPTADAANFEVTNLDDTGAGSLRDAVAQANAAGGADTITFASSLSGTIATGSEIVITDDLTITGPGSAAVTLDGADANRIFQANTNSLDVSGLSFTNGAAQGSSSGGAIAAYGQSLHLDDVVVSSSSAYRGGGVFASANDLRVTDSVLADNYAGYSGGGLTIDGNSSADPNTQEILIRDTIVSGNESVRNGGGLALYDNYVGTTVDTSTISGNTVNGSGNTKYEDGGGIWIEDTYYQSGIANETVISNSTVTGNATPDAGGGISFGENFYARTAVVNSTVTGNSAGYGGGVSFADLDTNSVPDAEFALENSTVFGNDATAGGGGVWLGYGSGSYGSSDGNLSVSSSIVSNNTAPGTPDLGVRDTHTGTAYLGNSLLANTKGAVYIEDPAGTVLTGVYPKLGPLQDNGGPTETRMPAATSPVINSGLANGLATDQRGAGRTFEYPDVPNTLGSDGTDMGAVELDVVPDNEVKDPYLAMKDPQLQGKKKIKLKVRAGAGEEVTAKASGVIRLGHGNAVKMETEVVAADQRATLVLKPKTGAAKRRVKKALKEGRKAKAEIDGRLIDEAGNKYKQTLTALLKLKKK